MTWIEHLAKCIETEMEKGGWTRSSLAREIEVSPSTIGRMVAGHTQPTLPMLLAVADALQVPVDQLLRPIYGGKYLYKYRG